MRADFPSADLLRARTSEITMGPHRPNGCTMSPQTVSALRSDGTLRQRSISTPVRPFSLCRSPLSVDGVTLVSTGGGGDSFTSTGELPGASRMTEWLSCSAVFLLFVQLGRH